MSNYVYILKCSDKSYYTGYTNNLEKRINNHNNKKASKYTRSRVPVKYVFIHKCVNKIEATRFEYKIKQLSRNKKEKLIKGLFVLEELFNI